MKFAIPVSLTFLVALFQPSLAAAVPKDTLPIFFFHGYRLTHTDFNYMVGQLKNSRKVTALNACETTCTEEPGWKQVNKVLAQVRNVIKADPRSYQNGYHFVGHSWGAVLARAVMQTMDEHKVVKLLSLDGSQSGASYYGNDKNWPDKLKTLSKDMGISLVNSNDAAVLIQDLAQKAYTPSKQGSSWRANFFHVPHADYYAKNEFMAILNGVNPNEGAIAKRNPDLAALKTTLAKRKSNFLKVKHVYLFHTGEAKLPNSQLFAGYKTVSSYSQPFVVQDWKSSDEYAKDTFGLKSLDRSKRLSTPIAPNTTPHMCWVVDSGACKTADIFAKYVLPVLEQLV